MLVANFTAGRLTVMSTILKESYGDWKATSYEPSTQVLEPTEIMLGYTVVLSALKLLNQLSISTNFLI